MSKIKLLPALLLTLSLGACDCFRESHDCGSDRESMRSHRAHSTSSSGSNLGTGGYAGPSAATRNQTNTGYTGAPADTGPKGPMRGDTSMQ